MTAQHDVLLRTEPTGGDDATKTHRSITNYDKPAAKVDVTDTWKAAVEVGGQTGEPTFTLKQDGAKVTAKYIGSLGEQDVSGKITGDKVEVEFSIDLGKVVTPASQQGDHKGTAKYGDLEGQRPRGFLSEWRMPHGSRGQGYGRV